MPPRTSTRPTTAYTNVTIASGQTASSEIDLAGTDLSASSSPPP